MKRKYRSAAGWLPTVLGLALFAVVAVWMVSGVREAAGRLACLLARRAERVVRVFCGLPLELKGGVV